LPADIARRPDPAVHRFLARLSQVDNPRQATVGVYRGFDQASRRAGSALERSLRNHVARVVAVTPCAAPAPPTSEEERSRVAAHVGAPIDALVDACPVPRAEAAHIAALLDVPLITRTHTTPPGA
jgi:hypothetical protein